MLGRCLAFCLILLAAVLVCLEPGYALMLSSGQTIAQTLTEIGAGVTLVNNATTANKVPVRFGYGFARGDMPLGNTIVCQDETGATYPCQVDQLSTRTGMPNATDTPGWLHAVVSLIYTPSWTAGASHTFHVFKQSGTYTPGTGLPTSALTGAHRYQVLYNNVKNWAGSAVGSGNFTCDLNNAIAAGARAGVGAGVSSGGGGYTKIEDGQVVTTLDALAPAIDNSSGTPQGQVMCEFFVMMWQSSPGSGTLGQVQLATYIGQPWQNTGNGTTIGFMWGDASLYDATTSTTLRNFSQTSNYAPSDFLPDPQTWSSHGNAATAAIIYSFQCGNVQCNGNQWGTGGNGYLTASGTSVTNNNSWYTPTSTLSGNVYLYVGPNTGCSSGSYQIMSVSGATATLSSAPCGTGGTIQDWQIQSGFINNNGNLETGTVIQWSATGGGTLPTGISASRPYFVGELAQSNNSPGPFMLSNISTMNQWPDFTGFSSQGSCPSGSCIVATRKVALQPWEGTWLFADDIGTPFWVAGANPANVTRLYPALTTTQKTYFESTALVPPYWLAGPASAPSPYVLPGDTAHAASGPFYESLSNGPQETNIDGGSTHESIGNMGGLEANAFMNMSQANWDLMHVHALTMASAFGHYVLNTATGWYTPYDCGPYPNGNLASCGTYGSPVGAAGGHTADFMLWVNPNNSAQWTNFTTPASLTGFLTMPASQNQFDSGIFWSGGTDGSNTSMSHEPDYGNALAYIIGGEPWYLRGMQGWGNFAMISQYNRGDQVASNVFTIDQTVGGNPYTYSGTVLMGGGTEQPRGTAWSFRNIMYPAMLGADSDPGRRLFWNYVQDSVGEAYDVLHKFYGLNTNQCSGCTADPNIETMGIIDPNSDTTQATFMMSYFAGVMAQFHGLTHLTMTQPSGASSMWLANEGGTLNKMLWYDMPLTNGLQSYAVCNYWATAENVMTRTNQQSGAPYTPGVMPTVSNAGGIFIVGDGTIAWRNDTISSTGLVTPATYNQPFQGLIQNGDVFENAYIYWQHSSLGNIPYYAINATSNSSGASFNLSTSVGGSTFIPSDAPNTYDLGWRPQGCASAGVGPADGGGVDGYSAEDWAQFNMGLTYGLTLPNLTGAVSNLLSRWNMPMFSASSFGNLNWQAWYMAPANQGPPPSQTIASISPTTGSCQTGTAGVTCASMSVTMSNGNSPNFSADGGTFSLVAAGGSCSGGDTSDFAINSSSGAITLSNAGATVQTDTVCVEAQTTASTVTNSPQYQSVSINVMSNSGGGGNISLKNHGVCTAYEGNAGVTSGSCTVTVNATGDGVIVVPTTCNGPSCAGGTAIPQITALTYSGGTCGEVSNTHTGGSSGSTGVDILFCPNMAASGSVTLSFTASGGGGGGGLEYPALFWLDYSGIAASGAAELGNNAFGTATAGTPFTVGLGSGGTSQTSQANELVFSACTINPSSSQTLTAQQTQIDTASSNAGGALDEYTIPAAIGTSPMGCTTSGTGGRDYAISVAAFKHS